MSDNLSKGPTYLPIRALSGFNPAQDGEICTMLVHKHTAYRSSTSNNIFLLWMGAKHNQDTRSFVLITRAAHYTIALKSLACTHAHADAPQEHSYMFYARRKSRNAPSSFSDPAEELLTPRRPRPLLSWPRGYHSILHSARHACGASASSFASPVPTFHTKVTRLLYSPGA